VNVRSLRSRRIFNAMSRPLDAYCPPLPTRETDKSLPVLRKAGRAGGDRNNDDWNLKDLSEMRRNAKPLKRNNEACKRIVIVPRSPVHCGSSDVRSPPEALDRKSASASNSRRADGKPTAA